MSRRHAVLRRSGGSVVVEDLDSTNGTFVNGERIRSPITVGPGDQVRVGRTMLEIEPDQRVTTRSCRHPRGRIRSEPPRRHRPVVSSRGARRDPALALAGARKRFATRALEQEVARARGRSPGRALGVIAYVALVDRPAENDFASRANEACAAVQRAEGGVDLSRTPTRGELQGARNVRLQALGAIRVLERPEQDDAVSVSRFLSAFGETNASITALERAIGGDNRAVVRAVGKLRGDVRDERELAAKAGIAGCGGLAIR